jgi:hypothetical protein
MYQDLEQQRKWKILGDVEKLRIIEIYYQQFGRMVIAYAPIQGAVYQPPEWALTDRKVWNLNFGENSDYWGRLSLLSERVKFITKNFGRPGYFMPVIPRRDEHAYGLIMDSLVLDPEDLCVNHITKYLQCCDSCGRALDKEDFNFFEIPSDDIYQLYIDFCKYCYIANQWRLRCHSSLIRTDRKRYLPSLYWIFKLAGLHEWMLKKQRCYYKPPATDESLKKRIVDIGAFDLPVELTCEILNFCRVCDVCGPIDRDLIIIQQGRSDKGVTSANIYDYSFCRPCWEIIFGIATTLGVCSVVVFGHEAFDTLNEITARRISYSKTVQFVDSQLINNPNYVPYVNERGSHHIELYMVD